MTNDIVAIKKKGCLYLPWYPVLNNYLINNPDSALTDEITRYIEIKDLELYGAMRERDKW